MTAGEKAFTPTEDLILDVLAARYRTGEIIWNFSTRLTKALNSLQARGLIWQMDGNVPSIVRASLTARGVALLDGSDYQSPIEEELQETRKQLAAAERQTAPDRTPFLRTDRHLCG